MQLSLDINITNQEMAHFVKNKSPHELKSLFIHFIENQMASTKTTKDSLDYRLKNLNVINPQKGKRIKEALDSLNKKLGSERNSNLSLIKETYLKEKFSL